MSINGSFLPAYQTYALMVSLGGTVDLSFAQVVSKRVATASFPRTWSTSRSRLRFDRERVDGELCGTGTQVA
jgi:hypothetical protein